MTTTADVLTNCEEKMKKAVANLAREFHTIRTGRANPALLDRVEAEYYGSMTQLKSLANIATVEGRTLLITPYDKTCLKDIETAINKANLGLTPNNDGNVIRINLPPLTEERRKEFVKLIKKFAEDNRVSIRNSRREGQDELKKLKGAQVSEDEIKRQEDALQKLTDKYVKEIDRLAQEKEAEVMEV
jgi:ribosome recycling factor